MQKLLKLFLTILVYVLEDWHEINQNFDRSLTSGNFVIKIGSNNELLLKLLLFRKLRLEYLVSYSVWSTVTPVAVNMHSINITDLVT